MSYIASYLWYNIEWLFGLRLKIQAGYGQRDPRFYRSVRLKIDAAQKERRRKMHELGILNQIIHVVEQVATQNSIEAIKQITLEIGLDSGVVPRYLKKLMPIAVDSLPLFRHTELNIRMVGGKGLVIKDIGY